MHRIFIHFRSNLSYAKAFSLSIRLFANMTAGHTLMHILSFGVLNFLKIPFFGILGIIPLLVFLCVCLMEFGISILQAYVFFILIVIYFNEAVQTSQFQKTNLIFNYKVSKEKRKKRKQSIRFRLLQLDLLQYDFRPKYKRVYNKNLLKYTNSLMSQLFL